ncbi:MAG: 3'-5' exonuclease domain-containing protein 2 [Opitutales bacterium]|nr:3'-5' exonuclease domain-containing protein 2 [Opitutales bacterium]
MPDKDDSAAAFKATISKEEVNILPLSRWGGSVHLINNQDDVPAAVEKLRKCGVLGFDTETRPTFRKGQNHPAALLQLATEDEVYLFQLLQLKALEGGLVELLADPSIVKAGVAVRDDIKKLQDIQPFEPGGFVELADITQRAGIINTGLRSLAAILLGIRISKSAQISNWAKPELSLAQIHYAATDAWVSRRLYAFLDGQNLIEA